MLDCFVLSLLGCKTVVHILSLKVCSLLFLHILYHVTAADMSSDQNIRAIFCD
jgi:hypothetical protein